MGAIGYVTAVRDATPERGTERDYAHCSNLKLRTFWKLASGIAPPVRHASLQARGRGVYLQCSHCHVPPGGALGFGVGFAPADGLVENTARCRLLPCGHDRADVEGAAQSATEAFNQHGCRRR